MGLKRNCFAKLAGGKIAWKNIAYYTVNVCLKFCFFVFFFFFVENNAQYALL